MPLYQKVPAKPISLTSATLIRPSLSGTHAATYTQVLTGTGSRYLTQVSTSTRLQTITLSGNRYNLGLVTFITNNGSLDFTTFRSTSDNPIAVMPLDIGSPTTGTTFITQKSNTAFTITSGSYQILTGSGILGPYSMTLADSNFTLQFSYDSAYLTWATSSSAASELSAGVPLVLAATISSGTVYHLADNILRIV